MIGVALARLGTLGPRALPVGLLLGLVIPPLADLARPLFGPSIFVMLVLSIMRVDLRDLAARLREPGRLLLALLWLQLVVPVAAALALGFVGMPPTLTTAMVLYVASPPVLASVAYAAMLRLDVSSALLTMIAATLLYPIVLPPLVLALIGLDLAIGTGDLMLRLALLIGGSFALGTLLRRWLGTARIEKERALLDGLIVVVMSVFAVSVMGGMTERLLTEPLQLLLLASIAFGFNLTLQTIGLATAIFLPRRVAVTLAMMTGQRNMGILMAAIGATVEPEVFVYFVLAQLPIYTLPALLQRLYAGLAGTSPIGNGGHVKAVRLQRPTNRGGLR